MVKIVTNSQCWHPPGRVFTVLVAVTQISGSIRDTGWGQSLSSFMATVMRWNALYCCCDRPI